MDNSRRDRITAAALTALLSAGVLAVLLCARIAPAQFPPKDAPQAEEPEIFFADIDYQELLSQPTPTVDGRPASSAASELSGTDLADSGSGQEAPPLVAADAESPMAEPKAEPEPDPGPTQEEIEAAKRAAIRERMGKATNLRNDQAEGSGRATDGNASAGNNPGADGLGLDGRRRLNSPNPGVKNAQGRVWVRISVDSQGAVTAAEAVRSSGFGPREAEVRAACVEASRKLRYNPDPEKPRQSGTITWNIK